MCVKGKITVHATIQVG